MLIKLSQHIIKIIQQEESCPETKRKPIYAGSFSKEFQQELIRVDNYAVLSKFLINLFNINTYLTLRKGSN